MRTDLAHHAGWSAIQFPLLVNKKRQSPHLVQYTGTICTPLPIDDSFGPRLVIDRAIVLFSF